MLLAIASPQHPKVCCKVKTKLSNGFRPYYCVLFTHKRFWGIHKRTHSAVPPKGPAAALGHRTGISTDEHPYGSWPVLLSTASRLAPHQGWCTVHASAGKSNQLLNEQSYGCRTSLRLYAASPLGRVFSRCKQTLAVQLSSKWTRRRQQPAATVKQHDGSQQLSSPATVNNRQQRRGASQRQQKRKPKEQQGMQTRMGGPPQQLEPALLLGQANQQQQQQHLPSYATFRAAAAGSTDLLLTVLSNQLPFITDTGTPLYARHSFNSACTQLTSKQRRALLRGALVCTAWHCHNHQLLPVEAKKLQDMLLRQLLPALAPHVAHTQKAVLARVVFALGSCAAAVWQSDAEVLEAGDNKGNDKSRTEDPEQQKSQYDTIEGTKVEQQPPLSPTGGQQQLHHQQQHLQFLKQQGQQGLLSSGSWVQGLLQLLDPQQLTAGSLLAAWKGAALHQVRPPDSWLHQASLAAYYALQQNNLDFNDVAALLQACAELEYAPPSWLMHYLVIKAQSQLPFFNPADLSGMLASLHALSFRPSNTFLRVWCEASSRLLQAMTVGQLAAAAEAMSWAGYSPQLWWARRFTAASLTLLPVATTEELLLLLDAALNLRLKPPVSWLHECYCHLRANKDQLTLSQVADAAHVLAQLQPLPISFIAHHRAWLAQWLQQQQPADVATLSRSELLYTLYAAGKLGVKLGRGWVEVALQQLHGKLAGAAPAELVAMLVVFSHFMRQQYTEAVVPLMWMQDCLAAAVGCLQMFSYEGLLQLLMTCKDMQQKEPYKHQGVEGELSQPEHCSATMEESDVQQDGPCSIQQPQQAELLIQHSIDAISDALLVHVSKMSLVQLARVCKTLEAAAGSSRPDWYQQLLQQCKAALAEKG